MNDEPLGYVKFGDTYLLARTSSIVWSANESYVLKVLNDSRQVLTGGSTDGKMKKNGSCFVWVGA